MLAPLLFVGVGCGRLWDQYTLPDYGSEKDRSWRNWGERNDGSEPPAGAGSKTEQQPAAFDPPRRAPTRTYGDIAKKTPDEIRASAPIVIPVLVLDGEMFPFPEDQFTRTEPDKCANTHYHAGVGYTLALKRVREPDTPCGFGSTVAAEEVDTEAIIKWLQEGPKAQR